MKTTSNIEKFMSAHSRINTNRYVVDLANGKQFVLDASPSNVSQRAEQFAAYRKSEVVGITCIGLTN